MSRGVLAVVSGFSGAGKGTIMKSLMAKYDNYADVYKRQVHTSRYPESFSL